MAQLESTSSSGEVEPINNDHARVIVPPPLVYVPTLVTGIALHFSWLPFKIFPQLWMGHATGWPFIVVSVLLALWAVRTMFRSGENPSAYKPTGAIVSAGPYAFTRNPIYVSFVLLYGGIALALNTAWPLALLPLSLIAIHYGVIRREELYLEKLFGTEYRRYRAGVRRWL